MCFLRNGSSYSFETCTIVIITPENLRVHWVWPSKYKEKWCFIPNVFFFSETDHHTALKLVPLWSSHLKTWECTEFGPLNTKKSDALAQNVLFFRSGSSYSFETCTTVIIRPENLRVNWIWYTKYNEKWCFRPKCVFSEMDHHTALKLVPLWSSDLKTSECTEFGSLNTKKSVVLSQNLFFFRNGSLYSFETCTIVIIRPENLRVH